MRPPNLSACPCPPGCKYAAHKPALSCLLKSGWQAGSGTWTVGSGERRGAKVQPCSWDTLLWWLCWGSPLPGLLLFLSRDGTAPGREAKALSTGCLPAACPNTHPSTTLSGLPDSKAGLGCPPRHPTIALPEPRQPLQEPGALMPGAACAPKAGLLPVSTGLGHAGVWQPVFYTILSPTGYMGFPGDPI